MSQKNLVQFDPQKIARIHTDTQVPKMASNVPLMRAPSLRPEAAYAKVGHMPKLLRHRIDTLNTPTPNLEAISWGDSMQLSDSLHSLSLRLRGVPTRNAQRLYTGSYDRDPSRAALSHINVALRDVLHPDTLQLHRWALSWMLGEKVDSEKYAYVFEAFPGRNVPRLFAWERPFFSGRSLDYVLHHRFQTDVVRVDSDEMQLHTTTECHHSSSFALQVKRPFVHLCDLHQYYRLWFPDETMEKTVARILALCLSGPIDSRCHPAKLDYTVITQTSLVDYNLHLMRPVYSMAALVWIPLLPGLIPLPCRGHIVSKDMMGVYTLIHLHDEVSADTFKSSSPRQFSTMATLLWGIKEPLAQAECCVIMQEDFNAVGQGGGVFSMPGYPEFGIVGEQ